MELDPRIHPNALKHLDEESALAAWRATQKFIRRESDDEPPRWLLIGWLLNRASVTSPILTLRYLPLQPHPN